MLRTGALCRGLQVHCGMEAMEVACGRICARLDGMELSGCPPTCAAPAEASKEAHVASLASGDGLGAPTAVEGLEGKLNGALERLAAGLQRWMAEASTTAKCSDVIIEVEAMVHRAWAVAPCSRGREQVGAWRGGWPMAICWVDNWRSQ
jgi:hypothetical protein